MSTCSRCGFQPNSPSATLPLHWNIDVLNIIRSGYTPPSAMVACIPDCLAVLEARHQTMLDDLACLEGLILQKRQEIASTRAEIERTKSLAAPIRSIPHETLLHIFSLVPDVPAFYAVNSRQPPCSFGHVCKFWRTLSRSSPSLWSRVTVRNSAKHLGFVNLLEQHLVLSNPCPLDVELSFPSPLDSNDAAMEAVINALSGHFMRLQRLQFEGGPYETECFFDMLSEANLRRLECLKAHILGQDPALNLQAYAIAFHASLRSLEMGLPFEAFRSVQVHWLHLTSFRGVFPGAASFHRFIVAAENLSHLWIYCIGDDDDDTQTRTVAVHEKINDLILGPSCSMSLALNNILLPHLEHLNLDQGTSRHSTCPSQKRRSYHAVLCRLLNRSQCTLKSFILGGAYLEPEFLTVILGTSTLTSLQLHLGDEANLSFDEVSTLLERLTITPSQQPLPRLREMVLTCLTEDDDCLFMNSRLHDLVVLRWNVTGDVARLSKLMLENFMPPEEEPPIAYETSTLAAFLLDLKDHGLNVVWKKDGRDVLIDAKNAVDSYL